MAVSPWSVPASATTPGGHGHTRFASAWSATVSRDDAGRCGDAGPGQRVAGDRPRTATRRLPRRPASVRAASVRAASAGSTSRQRHPGRVRHGGHPAAAAPPSPPVTPADVLAVGRVVVEVGFTTDPTVGGGLYLHWDDPVRGLWDDRLWAPRKCGRTSPRGCSPARGSAVPPASRARSSATSEGTATVVLNNSDGRFHPLNLTGPYARGAYAGPADGAGADPRHLRRAVVGPVARLRRRLGHHPPGARLLPGHRHLRPTRRRCSGRRIDAAPRPGRRRGTVRGPGPPHRRLGGLAGPDRLIDVGRSTLQGTDLQGDPWDRTAAGAGHGDRRGLHRPGRPKLVFKDRHAILTETLSTTSQAIFGRFGQPGNCRTCPAARSTTTTDIRNVIRIARGRAGAGGPRRAVHPRQPREDLRAHRPAHADRPGSLRLRRIPAGPVEGRAGPVHADHDRPGGAAGGPVGARVRPGLRRPDHDPVPPARRGAGRAGRVHPGDRRRPTRGSTGCR
jgi:hypothetical protein